MAACEPGPGPSAEQVPASADTPVSTGAEPEPTPQGAAGPEEIYYDLTELEWYRRGEPLVHAGIPYQPARSPLAAEFSALEPAGAFQGVRYYGRVGAERADTLFVPVHPRYWLPFTPRAVGEGR